ncbi:SDR family NAD(P)-dependent oxidoreductase [Devosia sp. PTR5]|jgi:NAD(P)-dependent dehydrogenase (short-subunit alcohol dehydrogenase family)|uniref:SDR family NAD(P)-dependent oxidoreductase n=1 Tax=Devosia oryzisoli TaxID=2774138 RepID=A0A927FRV1_9HYPH|nr:SDR family NAD(P)-dependent oxidoreductase [Devosia oryzisoli]MBD8065090.1 SDR family NAD(P)-dependent oxidoreductase [Devosia oryzisoli]
MTNTKTLADRVVLITGASRGLGYATAMEAARRGAHVVAVARTVGGLEELDDAVQAEGGSATLVPLDLRDGDAIDRLGAAIFERWGKLDGFVANAGQLGVLSPVSHIKPDEFDKVIATNLTANYRLVRSLDLLLRKSDAGRAVFMSSSAARSARPFWGLYAASKAALDALAKSYAGEANQSSLRVNVFYPGAVRTAMRAKAMPGENPETLPTPQEIAPRIVDLLEPSLSENGRLFDMATGRFEDL